MSIGTAAGKWYRFFAEEGSCFQGRPCLFLVSPLGGFLLISFLFLILSIIFIFTAFWNLHRDLCLTQFSWCHEVNTSLGCQLQERDAPRGLPGCQARKIRNGVRQRLSLRCRILGTSLDPRQKYSPLTETQPLEVCLAIAPTETPKALSFVDRGEKAEGPGSVFSPLSPPVLTVLNCCLAWSFLLRQYGSKSKWGGRWQGRFPGHAQT